ncbi:MAG: NADH-quinone oxidoreductase subunit N, partial [Alphaproteobacteria bacterium]|nr:NADH-quinone oxidoreductase subunit N [Alphaproteobacteria bacterium]
MSELPNLVPALPEIFLAVAAMALMMIGVYRGKESTDLAGGLAMIALVTAGFLELKLSGGRILTFNGMFVVDQFAVFCKLLVLAASV